MPPQLARWRPLADGLAALFRRHVELVIHDLASQTVVYVASVLGLSRATVFNYLKVLWEMSQAPV